MSHAANAFPPRRRKTLGGAAAGGAALGLLLLGAACDSFGSAVQSPDQDRKQYDETEKALLINRTEFATQQYREPYAVENTLFLYDYGSTGVHLHGYNKPLNRHVDYTFTVINNDAYGFEASDAWPAASVMILRGCMRADMRFWFSGLIMRSSLETWYHVGFFFHAGALTLSPKVLASGAFCVTAITRASSALRSWQKLSWYLSCRIHR